LATWNWKKVRELERTLRTRRGGKKREELGLGDLAKDG